MGETTDDAHQPVLEIAEVWAVGARVDSKIYDEMSHWVKQLQQADHPHTRALAEVIEEMGRLYGGIHAHLQPSQVPPLPPWLIQALENDLRLSPEVINELSQDEAQQLLIHHWTQPQD